MGQLKILKLPDSDESIAMARNRYPVFSEDDKQVTFTIENETILEEATIAFGGQRSLNEG